MGEASQLPRDGHSLTGPDARTGGFVVIGVGGITDAASANFRYYVVEIRPVYSSLLYSSLLWISELSPLRGLGSMQDSVLVGQESRIAGRLSHPLHAEVQGVLADEGGLAGAGRSRENRQLSAPVAAQQTIQGREPLPLHAGHLADENRNSELS